MDDMKIENVQVRFHCRVRAVGHARACACRSRVVVRSTEERKMTKRKEDCVRGKNERSSSNSDKKKVEEGGRKKKRTKSDDGKRESEIRRYIREKHTRSIVDT